MTCAKSAFTWAASGMFGYRTTRYPTSLSIASRSASFSSFPLWLASSSSMTAITWNALSQITKSAIFLSKLFLVCHDRAVISAPKLTCANTTISGSACVSRLCIDCSRSVSSLFLLGFSSVVFAFLFPGFLPRKKTATAINIPMTIKSFIFSPSEFVFINRNVVFGVAK